jgi:hypothetical protein
MITALSVERDASRYAALSHSVGPLASFKLHFDFPASDGLAVYPWTA